MTVKKKPLRVRTSTERLVHFSCAACGKWWSIGDAPTKKKCWYCPWCGHEHKGTQAAPVLAHK